MSGQSNLYPFSAIVGQKELKLALILNTINPRIGGVLIRGAKGTGKSTAVRALDDILPEIEVVRDCQFNCNPIDLSNMCLYCAIRLKKEGQLPKNTKKMKLVQLPLSITEDMLIGTLNTEVALKEGIKAIQPGILGEVNQNILYIDEINLLQDYLINCLLDPVSSGWNIIQREGISLTHPSRFTLMATMNPEEGELRPQILDRFAFIVDSETVHNSIQRIEIIKRNIKYEEDPTVFRKKWTNKQEKLYQRIIRARELLPKVRVPEEIYKSIAKTCSELKIDGHRPDIVTIKAAKALAAYNGNTIVKPKDIFLVSKFTLSHRTRKSGSEPPVGYQMLHKKLKKTFQKLETETHIYDAEISEVTATENIFAKLKPDIISKPKIHKTRDIPRKLLLLIMFIALLGASYMMSIFFVILSFIFSGQPLVSMEIVKAVHITKVWPFIAIISISFLLSIVLYRFFKVKSQGPEPLVHFYELKDRRLRRRIIKQHYLPKETSGPSSSNEIIIPLHSFLNRLRGVMMGRGPKVIESISQLRESQDRIDLSLGQKKDSKKRYLAGKHAKSVTSTHRGRYVWYEFPKKRPWDIALAPTIRAAAPYQLNRKRKNLLVKIEPQDIRVKVREMLTPFTIILLLDMSDSMSASLDNVRDAVVSLHEIAYKKRDRVGLVIFKGSSALILQHPTTNLNLVIKKLFSVGASDFTPLAAGMIQSWKILRNEKLRNKEIIPILIIISDGMVNVPLKRPLSSFTRNKFMNLAQADVIDAAYLLAKEGIRTIVINPSHEIQVIKDIGGYQKSISEKMSLLWIKPTSLLLEIPQITGGYYYGISEKGKIQKMVLMDALTIFDRL